MPVLRMVARSAASFRRAAVSTVSLIPRKLAMVAAVATPLAWPELAAAGRTAAADASLLPLLGTVVGAVGSLSQRASLKIAAASVLAAGSPFAASSACR